VEESIRKFFEYYDQYEQNKTKLQSDAFDHFQEIRFQIDEHRERLKERIDDIALAMIDQTKLYEVMYLSSLKEHFTSFDHNKSLEIELHKIEETFRSSNLLIETIKEMQQKQEESLSDIQVKLNEMNQVKADLEGTNEFIPNLSLLNQDETSLFGSIQVDGYWLRTFNSQILRGEQQSLDFIKLCEFSPNDKWTLLYRATRDGFSAANFHSKCDGHSNTLTLFKAKETSHIFGGFTSISWESFGQYKSDPNAFLFSLTNRDNQPCKIRQIYKSNSIYCGSYFGPIFGFGDDIHIGNNANTTMGSYSELGQSYKHPQPSQGKSYLAGSHRFLLIEIEVYQKE
jgi:hypothetical protein